MKELVYSSLPRRHFGVNHFTCGQISSCLTFPFVNSLKSNIQYATLKTLSLVSISVMSPQQSIKELFRTADCVCFDVDSTVIKDEGIDELAKFCGKGAEVKRLWVFNAYYFIPILSHGWSKVSPISLYCFICTVFSAQTRVKRVVVVSVFYVSLGNTFFLKNCPLFMWLKVSYT